MSFELCGKVINDREISDVRLFSVLMCLAEATNHETGACYPSIDRIAMVARCGRRTAIRSMEALEKKGWIMVIRRTDPNGGSLANIYRITKYLAGVQEGGATQTPLRVPARHSGGATQTKRGCQPCKEGGATVALEPVREENKEEEPIRNAPEEPVLKVPVLPIPSKECIVASFSLEASPEQKTKRIHKPKPVAQNPPSLSEFISYAVSIGIARQTSVDQYEVWCANDWLDGYGNPIFNWKGKLVTFKKKGCLVTQSKTNQPATKATRSY